MKPLAVILLWVGLASSALVCQDGTQCPDQSTCCQTETGFGCCPLLKAVCCSTAYCCPEGYTCNVQEGVCERNGLRIPLVSKTPPLENPELSLLRVQSNASVVFCDNFHHCPDGNTCCRGPTGTWFCCPHPSAYCCRDGYHCCPYGYFCDVTSTRCVKWGISIPSEDKMAALLATDALSIVSEPPSSAVYCGNQYYCPDGNTCCTLPSGSWACCPHPHAICCRDGYHCCPYGYFCDFTSTKCTKGGVSIPSEEKMPALVQTNALSITSESQGSKVYCGNQYYCPDGNTCCKLPSGSWGCCPHPHAICCRDGYHCCPYGYFCDFTSTKCTKGGVSIPSEEKMPALVQTNALSITSESPSSAVYCGNQYYCPDGNTCCKLPSGSWGCCPHPHAICCRDGYHCCPYGYICDFTSTRCKRRGVSIPSEAKIPAFVQTSALSITSESPSSAVYCGNKQYCPDGNTCCKLPSGSWGCCPHPHAICCRDGYHCCPYGYFCDFTSTKCTKGGVSIPSEEKMPALVQTNALSITSESPSSAVYCGNQYYCPDGNTCCKLPSGSWGCCPYRQV
ncbi:progranulin-like isoform X2 [Latimeria chalumnae]|uniref:progranulin-like isoform X2 n=1 Tax=Latimeria chalumnae TaxID=7897 RepID=UPI00313B2286